MKLRLVPFMLCLLVIALFSCNSPEEKTATMQPLPAELPDITIMTHDSFSISKAVVEQFEKKVQAKLVIIKSGDAGEALNKAILSKNNPLADIFYGVDSTFLSRALKADMFVSYLPQHLDTVDKSLQLDPENRLVPVDFGDVCLNYDIGWFKEHNLQPPTLLEDLIKPEYMGLTVVQNPATSSPGLAFLLATISRFGEDGYLDYWQKLKANQVEITSGWKDAYWGKFTAASEGDRPVVVSYASSPAAEVFYSETKLSAAPTAVVLENNSAFRQIEFAGILKGTDRLELARKAMDFILSAEFQEDIPLQMFVFPANKTVTLPVVFQEHARKAERPALLDPQLIDAKREVWLREWTERMLQ
ncbi:MAG: thiamine ABC transporter substrate-binding protein [Thermodesulfobacteriota bacterium]|nr:thiamine ABC transporter substrate-binding protein [Thermodesulfobacteriota bacterium]